MQSKREGESACYHHNAYPTPDSLVAMGAVVLTNKKNKYGFFSFHFFSNLPVFYFSFNDGIKMYCSAIQKEYYWQSSSLKPLPHVISRNSIFKFQQSFRFHLLKSELQRESQVLFFINHCLSISRYNKRIRKGKKKQFQPTDTPILALRHKFINN